MTSGDRSRIKKVRTPGILTEDFTYDIEGRVNEYKQTVDARESYPMTTGYLYDTLDRTKEIHYPAQYGLTGSPRKTVAHSFDSSSRLTALTVGGQQQAGDIVYDAADQTTSIKIGAGGTNQVTENYTFDPQTGLLTNQKAIRNGSSLLDLTYNYSRNNSAGTLNGKTGHLTKITDNLNANKNREYEFDAIGRLKKAKGGNGGTLWSQNYGFDRYGNRTSVSATGVAADSSTMPTDGIASLAFDAASNRITSSGFSYDSAGNQKRATDKDGNWINFEYDAANRLRIVKRDDTSGIQAFQYGSTNSRLIDYDYGVGQNKFYASVGGQTLAEYVETVQNQPVWTKSYNYLGGTQLSTVTPNGAGGEYIEYDHPDRLGNKLKTNQTLGTVYEQAHLPYGKALDAESTITTSNKRFTSYDRSAPTGLDYAVNRTYDSKQGRFTQADPIGMNASSLAAPQTLNLYTYCGNDPINYTDPSGLFWGFFKSLIKWVFAIIAVVVAVLTIVAAPFTWREF